MKIEIYANNIEALEREINNLRYDHKIKSITYKFNTIEYYKSNPYYCEALVEIQ